jgi:anti-sigma factor RsiW
MLCNTIKEYLERYADKSLSASTRTAVENHLKACPDCASAYGEVAKIRRLLKGAGIPPVPGDLAACIMANVKSSKADGEKRAGVFWAFIQEWANAALPARAAVASALLILVIAGIFMSKDLWSKPESLTYGDFPELDVFSATQKGSLENTYLQITSLPAKGDYK